jgi:hypothetical protein
MSDIVSMGTVDIGERIKFCYYEGHRVSSWGVDIRRYYMEGDVVAIYTGGSNLGRCVAFSRSNVKKSSYDMQTFYSNYLTDWGKYSDEYLVAENAALYDQCDYCVWIPCHVMVKHITKSIILHPDQKCIGCDLPAPHAQPNNGNNFVCISCKVIDEINQDIQLNQ